MEYTLDQVKYENNTHWVLELPGNAGYEVYKTGITHSTRCAQIGFFNGAGLQRAVDEANRRMSQTG